MNDQFFRVTLAQLDLLLQQTGLIHVVTACISRLSVPEALETPGVFRESGSRQRVEQLLAQLSDSPPRTAEDAASRLAGEDVRTVSSLFTYWLSEIPEPLVPAESCVALRNISAQHQLGSPSFQSQDWVPAVSVWMRSLPPVSQLVLRELLPLLSSIAARAEVNKMTAQNLSIVLSPLILWCTSPSTIAADINLHAKIFQELISHSQSILSNH
ncbi:MAG: Rho GTPase-activating protein [archaeon]|nr:Rho GTPase-activating protein [archaeon]